jgi:hypothetical protein
MHLALTAAQPTLFDDLIAAAATSDTDEQPAQPRLATSA